NTFVFVISDNSLSSKVCQAEFEYAANLDKRIVPVVHRDAPSGMVPPEIAARNWVFFRQGDDPDGAFDALNRALDVDVGWLRFHTRLLMRAKEWSAHDADDSYLLAGTDLDETQNWLGRATHRQPRVNSLQTAYVAASAHGNVVRQRRQVRGFYVASLAFGLLQPGITYAFAFDEISESGLIVLAPLWIIAMAFGGSGLLTPRPTLMKSAAVAGGVAVLMIVFYQTVWPLL
ncbi:MAG: toll/interleukin-1 receptor domain-containing protein, partial [Pseudonocardiaceae bacterium]